MKKYIDILINGLIKENPVFVLVLGMCPTLATTSSAINGLSMGLATCFVLICSNLVISLIKNITPDKVHIPVYICIIATFVTVLQMLLAAYVPEVNASLGIFIPLIVVNCIILARAEAFASKNPPLPSVVDGIAMGLGLTFALCLVAVVRELLGAGSIFGVRILPEAYPEMIIFILPAGAFLTLGFVIAVVQKVRNSVSDRARAREIKENRQSSHPEGDAKKVEEVDVV